MSFEFGMSEFTGLVLAGQHKNIALPKPAERHVNEQRICVNERRHCGRCALPDKAHSGWTIREKGGVGLLVDDKAWLVYRKNRSVGTQVKSERFADI